MFAAEGGGAHLLDNQVGGRRAHPGILVALPCTSACPVSVPARAQGRAAGWGARTGHRLLRPALELLLGVPDEALQVDGQRAAVVARLEPPASSAPAATAPSRHPPHQGGPDACPTPSRGARTAQLWGLVHTASCDLGCWARRCSSAVRPPGGRPAAGTTPGPGRGAAPGCRPAGRTPSPPSATPRLGSQASPSRLTKYMRCRRAHPSQHAHRGQQQRAAWAAACA